MMANGTAKSDGTAAESLRQRLVTTQTQPLQHQQKRVSGGRRILERGAVFNQSNGVLRISRSHKMAKLSRASTYHTLVHMSTWKIVFIMILSNFAITLLFAGLYFLISDECGLEMERFVDAVYFSVETMMTIGYGVVRDDPYFEGCISNLILIYLQSIVGILYDAISLGVIYARISRVNQRATTIVFSDKAVINFVNGHPYFCFQVCEMRKHQLIEAHVRCYAFLRKRASPRTYPGGDSVPHSEEKNEAQPHRHFMTKTMRLQHPDDELGGMLLLAVPQVVSHRIDHWSPLCPPELCYGSRQQNFPGLIRRAVDGELGREEPLSEEQQRMLFPGYPSTKEFGKKMAQDESRNAIRSYMADVSLEVIVLVEGIESSQSGTVQCRHSYNVDDIVFDKTFAECVFEDTSSGGITIDFSRFHSLEESPPGSAFGYSASHVA